MPRLLAGASMLGLALLTCGCAAPGARPGPLQSSASASAATSWTGRLGLQVEDAPSQSFFASFDLQGNADAGSLSLLTPIGSTVAVLRWAPGEATLQRGSQVQRFDSLSDLAAQATGTPIPVAALFDWLAGTPRAIEGWHADLSQLDQGRLVAIRQQPLPVATLRVVLER